tara:strand:- start:1635 stop:2948 length:1314 start_codon:yes stop_codon:yes gene_type:complete
MKKEKNIFLNKKILIYGLGKTGISAFKFLKNKNDIFLFDDYQIDSNDFLTRKKTITYSDVIKSKFDRVILSPGIDLNKCRLSNFLKKNKKKIYSDLDVFYSFYKNDSITVTGTNGKSTTCQLLYEILSQKSFDVKLVGNIGNPILSVNNVKKKTIFVIEASSYQLEYSKIFCSKYSAILNIAPDHLERHKTLNNYIKAKFKLIKNQPKGSLSFIKKNDLLVNKELLSNKVNHKVIKVSTTNLDNFIKKIGNEYFLNANNKENLSFVLAILKEFGLRSKSLIKAIKNFKGLNYRQQIIFKGPKLIIINDSKSTSFSSSEGILKLNSKIFWLLGGKPKKGDKFNLSKKYFKNIKAFIYGKNFKFFNNALNNKIQFQNFKNLNEALKKIFFVIKKEKSKKIILFSPCAASFDSFKNFEDRGYYFNKLVKKNLNVQKTIDL